MIFPTMIVQIHPELVFMMQEESERCRQRDIPGEVVGAAATAAA